VARILKTAINSLGHVLSREDNVRLRDQLPNIIKAIYKETYKSNKIFLPVEAPREYRDELIVDQFQNTAFDFS
jgi:hypothetical protein